MNNNDETWLFLDLNSYFASVEQQHNPALRGKPVAVVPMDTDSTCAIAASKEAKAYGIKTGTKIYDAKRMCPRLICVMARHDLYVDYHHRVIDEVINHVPINKIWSVDELSSRLPQRLRSREAATDVAHRLKEGLRKNVGELITCSIGVAPNGFLAKVASDMKKPDGLVILERDDLPGPLFNLKLTDLPGINVNMEARLKNAGVYTVEDLWNISPKHARAIWNNVGGEKFWHNLRGHDMPDQETNPSLIGHSRILDTELRHPAGARLVARRLTVKAATRLRRKDLYAARFSLSVRAPDGPRWAREIKLSPAHDNFTFVRAFDDLWATMMIDLNPRQIKKVSVTLYDLYGRTDITPDLFDSASAEIQAQSMRDEKLSTIMDNVNKRYGAETLRLGVTPKTRAGHVGTKIAFNRIPDRAEFYE